MQTRNGKPDSITEAQGDALFLNEDQNLADLITAATARVNMGLGNCATLDVGAGAGDVAAGDTPAAAQAASEPVGTTATHAALTATHGVAQVADDADVVVNAAAIALKQKQTYVIDSAPTADHDSVDTASIGTEFRAGDIWLDSSGPTWYDCTDATPTAAVWTARSGGLTIADADKGEQGGVILDNAGYDGNSDIYITGYTDEFAGTTIGERWTQVPGSHTIDTSTDGQLKFTFAASQSLWESAGHNACHVKFKLPILGDWFMRVHVTMPAGVDIGAGIGIKDANVAANNYATMTRLGGDIKIGRIFQDSRSTSYFGTYLSCWIGLKKTGDAIMCWRSLNAEDSPPSLLNNNWIEYSAADPILITQKNFETFLFGWNYWSKVDTVVLRHFQLTAL